MRSAALLALLAALLVPAAALAQATPTPTPSATVSASPTATPSPTPTPTATPVPRTKAVQKVYDDYASDGTISVCKYSVKTLKRTLRTITPQFDTNFPDFRAAVKAGIKRHQRGNCKPAAATATPAPTATAAPTAAAPTPVPTPVPTAVPTAAPTSSPLQSGRLPSGTLHPVGPPKTPKQAKTPGTLTPSGRPAPTTITPTPTPTEFGPPRLVVQRASGHRDLTVPGALLGLALLMAVLLGLSALAAARSPRLAGVHHAWREAAYRTRGTWRDFSEWLRLGR